MRTNDSSSSLMIKKKKRGPPRFSIPNLNSISQLLSLAHSHKFNLSLNENIQVLSRITELAPAHPIHTVYSLNELLPKIKNQFNGEGGGSITGPGGGGAAAAAADEMLNEEKLKSDQANHDKSKTSNPPPPFQSPNPDFSSEPPHFASFSKEKDFKAFSDGSFFSSFASTSKRNASSSSNESDKNNFRNILEDQKEEYEDEIPLVGTLFWTLRNLHCFPIERSFWVSLWDKVLIEGIDKEADEVLKGIRGLDRMEERERMEEWERDVYREVFGKMEEWLEGHLRLRKYGWDDLLKICEIVVENKRQNSDLFNEIEFQIMKFVSEEREERIAAQDMIEFSYYFAKGGIYAEKIFDATLQCLIEKMRFEEKQNPAYPSISLGGEEIEQLMFYLNFNKEKDPFFNLDEQLCEWLFFNYFNENSIYDISGLLSLHKGISLLNISDEKNEKNLINFLENKLLQAQNNKKKPVNLSSIENYLKIRAQNEFKGDCKKFKTSIFNFFDTLCELNYEKFEPDNVYQFLMMIDNEEIITKFPKFFKVMPNFVEKYVSYYDFDELCYFYLIFLNFGGTIINEDSAKFHNEVNNIKEFIKFVSLRRGFKIDLNSNFHKLMNVVDLAEFFEGGS